MIYLINRCRIKSGMTNKTALTIDLFLFPNIGFFSLSCPYIITAHDLSYEFFPEFLSLKRKLWHKIINPKSQIQKSKKVITVSENTARDLIKYYKSQRKKLLLFILELANGIES